MQNPTKDAKPDQEKKLAPENDPKKQPPKQEQKRDNQK